MPKARKPRERNLFEHVFTPDPGEDGKLNGVELIRFALGRSFIIVSIALVAWFGSVTLGDLFAGAFGNWARPVGWLVGLAIGVAAPFMEAFGLWLAGREEGFVGKARMAALTALCIGVTVSMQILLGSDLIAADRERLDEAERRDRAIVERADTMRGTDLLAAKMAAAEKDVARAEARYSQALEWQRTIIEVRAEQARGGGRDERVTGIQAALSIAQDGLVREQTAASVAAELAAADNDLSEARARFDQALAAREAAEERISSGQVAEVELAATNALETTSLVKMFRQTARKSFEIDGDPRAEDPVAVDDRAKEMADWFVYAMVLMINACNFGLNNTGGRRRDDDEDEDAAPRVEPAPLPLPPPPFDPRPAPAAARVDDADWRRLRDREQALAIREARLTDQASQLLHVAPAVQAPVQTASTPQTTGQPAGFSAGGGPRRASAFDTLEALQAKLEREEKG